MPLDKRFRFDDHERISPIEEPSKGDHRQPGQTGGMARLHLPFLEQGELLSQEQILGDECCAGEDEQPKEGQQY